MSPLLGVIKKSVSLSFFLSSLLGILLVFEHIALDKVEKSCTCFYCLEKNDHSNKVATTNDLVKISGYKLVNLRYLVHGFEEVEILLLLLGE